MEPEPGGGGSRGDGALTVVAYAADPWESACPTLRLSGPCTAAGITLSQGARWAGDTLEARPELVDEADLVVIQRDFPRFVAEYAQVMARARRQGKPVIYDLDDVLYDLPADHADVRHYRPVRIAMLLAMVEADAVTVSTPALREFLTPYHPNVYVLPNYLNDRLWTVREASWQVEACPVVVGYMGSGTHSVDLDMIAPALLRTAERFGEAIEIRFMGRTPPPAAIAGLPNVVWDRARYLDYAEFAAWFGAQRLDIGLAPLCDTPFNQGKSWIKYLEYTAVGAAGIYSRVAPYEAVITGENGLLAGALDEWEAALARLIANTDERREVATNAREDVCGHWLLSDHADAWRRVYAGVLAARPAVGREKCLLQAVATVQLWQAEDDERLAGEQRAADALREQVAGLERRAVNLAAQSESYRLQMEELAARGARQEEAIGWLGAELRQVRGSITWRGTEPVRQAYAGIQRLQRSLKRTTALPEAAAEQSVEDRVTQPEAPPVESPAPETPEEALVPFERDSFFWTEERYRAVAALPVSPVTDIIICVGKNTQMAERCVAAVRRNTAPATYQLRLVVHEEDRPGLSAQLTDGADVIVHTMTHFNFARANNLAMARCAGDVVLLNDDTEPAAGWLERLRTDSRGYALTAARTGYQCSGNPDLWGEGDARLTWYPVNMFCAFIPRRVRDVVGLLEEEFAYYGGEDVDYSARALQHGFPLVVSSAFVYHAGTQSFGPQKERLMRESDKIITERYGLRPPFDLSSVKPPASVIIATRNRAAQLPRAAQSILTGLYPEIELMIVDDASTDETPEVVAALQAMDPRVIGIRLPKQGGAVRARQRGVAASRGQFIAFMDDDDLAWPNRILAPLQYIMTRPNLDAVYCAFDIVSEMGRTRGRTLPFDAGDYLNMKFDIGSGILLLRRQLIEDVPFMAQYERAIDFDWVFRVVRHGYQIDYCPAVVLDYNRSGPGEAHLSGNEAAVRVHGEIQERERLMRDFGRK